jgi:DNA-binding XRE family transcriptional regulator
MFTKIRFARNLPYGMSALELSGPKAEMHIKLLCRLGKRERRILLRGLLGQVRPWMSEITTAVIDHTHDGEIRTRRSREREIAFADSISFESPATTIGFQIRIRRSELGRSQSWLARESGITRSHLSDLERGKYFPSLRTLQAIENALKVSAAPTQS